MHDESRFWSKALIESPDECWEWQAGRDNNGYGVFWMDGRSHKAARVSWELHHGPVPAGHHVTQTCRNPACINPHHVALAVGERASGSDHPHVQLTAKDIPHIRAALAAGASYTALGKRYGVNKNAIRDIALGNSWAWVKDEPS